ncbi:helix-turn-helix transcriptional regulator [Streptomyces sp. NPDC054841]
MKGPRMTIGSQAPQADKASLRTAPGRCDHSGSTHVSCEDVVQVLGAWAEVHAPSATMSQLRDLAIATVQAAWGQALTSPLPGSLTARPQSRGVSGRLTSRQIMLLRCLARGWGNREIGEAVSVATDTVPNHIRALCRAMCAANRTHAVALGFSRGLLVPHDLDA